MTQFSQWRHLRRIRRVPSPNTAAVRSAKQEIAVAADFLDRLHNWGCRHREREMATNRRASRQDAMQRVPGSPRTSRSLRPSFGRLRYGVRRVW
ncbi:conserved hypothetical protein [Rhodococcus ruber]|uniref:Uncharacterized protein n=1 Tax=Rhodococcus ruber TaxID=1830 RepID=A0A098BEQ7_9NOCA|nr:conserved hypothetical protein [Rhodococcus ruber]